MLSFTARGAVRTPDALQIRVGASDSGALRAGLPPPSRDLTDLEILSNLDHFTVGRATTRTRSCRRLVLSGCQGRDLVASIRHGRAHGITEVVLHGLAPPSTLQAVDRVVLRCSSAGDVLREGTIPWIAAVPILDATLDQAESLAEALILARPTEVILAWPLPGDQVPPPLAEGLVRAAALERLLASGGLDVRLGGLPACMAPTSPARTRNRFYVDADHQHDAARMFLPDVVEFYKPDTCRACVHTASCDGVARIWFDRALVGVPQPIAAGEAGG